MNTIFANVFAGLCFMASGLAGWRPRPGMTRILNFPTRSFPGMTNNPMIPLDPFLGSL
jgi:hypothetical protein